MLGPSHQFSTESNLVKLRVPASMDTLTYRASVDQGCHESVVYTKVFTSRISNKMVTNLEALVAKPIVRAIYFLALLNFV
jgi:hypothetical protein